MFSIWFLATACGMAPGDDSAPDHPENPVFHEIVDRGVDMDGAIIRLPTPALPDGKDAEAVRIALREVAGDDRAAREMLRKSVTAPFILKTREVKAGDSLIRMADLYFVVHARLGEVDPDRALNPADGQSFEAGNMQFRSKDLAGNDLTASDVRPIGPLSGRKEWYTHVDARLLDRISVGSTSRVVVTRTPGSVVIATRTDHAFDRDDRHANRWAALTRTGNAESAGPARSYAGGASYAKITPLAGESGALFVESHLAFAEPHAWFQGNPILRSKFGVIAQDQVRRLRREIEKQRGEK